jgi:oxepin-CoA hydrolase/3-oxo-5,6-dehydrosuberyl-CoA semialdehyde dehydrogenase
MTSTERKTFLKDEVLELLQNLQPNTIPSFGLMTPQHMIEHLTWITKSSIKNYGEPEGELTKGQLSFKRFINNGAVFKHRPSDKTKADLPTLKYGSLEEAIKQIPIAIERFYNYGDAHPDTLIYNPMMGQLSFEEIEIFHYQHFRYHFWQFGLIEEFS